MTKHIETMTKAWQTIEAQQWDKVKDLFAGSGEFRMHAQVFNGAPEFVAMCQGWYAAFPDLKHEIVREIESGDSYCCEMVMTGTHTGTMRTPKGDLPATGKKIRMVTCDYIVFREGRVVSWHAYPDIGGMMAQLGVG